MRQLAKVTQKRVNQRAAKKALSTEFDIASGHRSHVCTALADGRVCPQTEPERAMAEGKRPGGLTALAVINFVFGGIAGLFRLLGVAAVGLLRDKMPPEEAAKLPSNSVLYLVSFIGIVSAALLIAAGVGYLKQKRVLGRMLGNAYAACSLLLSVAELTMVPNSFSIWTIIGLIYPLLTLILVNTTFKDDLGN
jgi:hypothetical protein